MVNVVGISLITRYLVDDSQFLHNACELIYSLSFFVEDACKILHNIGDHWYIICCSFDEF